MKRFLPHLGSVILVSVGLIVGSVVAGNNAVAQKIAAITGGGTSNRLAKWTTDSGVLGNSSLTEDKYGNLTIGGSIKFPDGSVQTSAATETSTNNHQELTLIAQPAESLSFDLPRKDFPVRIDISTSVIVEQFTPCNGTHSSTVTSGPMFTSAIAVLDSSTGRMSSSASGPGMEGVYWAAFLGSDQATGRMMILVPSQCGGSCCNNTPQFVTSGPITYHVSLWY
jgi:hypothetical protein